MSNTNETNCHVQDEDEIELDSDSENEEEIDDKNSDEVHSDEKKLTESMTDSAANEDAGENTQNKPNTINDSKVKKSSDKDDNNPTASAPTERLPATATAAATTKSTSKKMKLQERLRKLQLKINQSKKLNHQEVLQEGERLSSKEAFQKHKKQTSKNDAKQREQEQWDNIHKKNVSTLLSVKNDGSSRSSAQGENKKEIQALMQSGSDSIRHSNRKMETKEQNRYSSNDHYNSQGQFRNYERSLKSIVPNNNNHDDSIDLEQSFQSRERNGAKKLADEMKRRAKKSEKRKQKETEFEATDISSINKRNKHFNEKINRNYDKHTAEIRQNLERGTAL